jgi:hypothetical protein
LKNVGLDNIAKLKQSGEGYSYCMAYVYSMSKKTFGYFGKKTPLIKTGGCSVEWKLTKKDKYTFRTFTAKQVYIGAVKLQPADVVIFSHNKTSEDFLGHTGFVISQIDNNRFTAIEGNTVGVDDTSQQREQKKGTIGGVFTKKRSLAIGTAAFPVEGFIRIN